MKRFTETEKWRDPWFQKLDKESRTLWLWLCDRVDNAGVIDICWPICNAETSGSFNEESMKAFGERIERLPCEKWWLPKFIEFQFGRLSEKSNVHQTIDRLLKKHSLYDRVSHRVDSTLQVKVKVKVKVKEEVKVKVKDKSVKLTDDDFINSLRSNPAYFGIDINQQLSKMDAWLLANPNRQKTRKFIVGWLNRCEKPIGKINSLEDKQKFNHSWDFKK